MFLNCLTTVQGRKSRGENIMNLDQIKQEAKKGCVASAVQLAEYYYSQDTAEAIKWAKMAGEADHVCGAYWMALCLQKEIGLSESEDPTVLEKTREYYLWSQKAYTLHVNNAPGREALHRKQLRALCEDAVFVRSYRLYLEGEYRNAVLLLKRETSYRCCLLMGLSLLEYYRKDNNAVEEDLFAACDCLSEISRLETETAELGKDEERVYALCALRYSKFRRQGFYPEGEKPNIKEAYRILRTTRDVVRDEELQKKLDDELAHYRKKFPGRYKYLG